MKVIILDEPEESKDVYLSDEIKYSFKAMRIACSTIDVKTEDKNYAPTISTMTPESIESLKIVYRNTHHKGPSQQAIFFETIHNFSMDLTYEEACSDLVDHIAREEKDIHQKGPDRSNCIERFLRNNLEIATYYFDVYDRNSFFSRFKRKIISMAVVIFGAKLADVIFHASTIATIFIAIKNIFSQYLDILLDLKMFTSLQHVFENFLVDKEKLVRISSLPLNEISYAYILFGLVSHLSHYIIFFIDFKHNFRMRDSKMQKIIFSLAICFPLHFTILEFARTVVQQLKTRNDFRIRLKDSMKTEVDADNDAQEYMTYRRKIKEITSRMMAIRNTLIKMLVVETVIENFPQMSIVITFMISELTFGYGKLLMIVRNGFVEFVGGSLHFLSIVVILVQFNKFGPSLNKIQGRSDFPFNNGMVGSLILTASSTLMIGAKLMLFSTVLSHAIVFYPVCMILETTVVVLYLKVIGIRLDIMKIIIPCVLSPVFISITNENYKGFMKKDKLKLLSVVALHILNLIFAYAPIYGLTQFLTILDDYKSLFSLRIHGISTLTYLATIGVYLVIDIIFKKAGNPWRYLYEEPHEIEQLRENESDAAPDVSHNLIDPLRTNETETGIETKANEIDPPSAYESDNLLTLELKQKI